MKSTLSIMLFALVLLASATPVANTGPSKGVAQLAKFDDLSTNPANPLLSPVGKYKGLNYRSFDVSGLGLAGTQTLGFKPQSGQNVAGAGLLTQGTTGSTALIPASPYKSFDLKSLYFACAVNSIESAVFVPEQCTVAFTAYKPGSNVAYQTINQQFNPTNPTLSKMRKATFPSTWQKMGKIEIAVVQAASTPTLTGLGIDNVAYTLYKD